ncbi:DEAD/DEAH box helicase [Sphingomonas sp.]|uniref:DEAD/DEAH box helicase n=1 Tax=Sphingomonas sp. TaxID=28214 RepID=UPI0035BC384E
MFEASQDTGKGWRIVLVRETPPRLPFGKATRTVVPFDDWIGARPSSAAAALARIVQAEGDGERTADGAALVVADAHGATLHPAFVARLSDSEAEALALPLATRLALNLRSSGLIHKDGFRIDISWTRSGGVPVLVRAGDGTIRHDGRVWRIPEPLYATIAAVEQVNAAPDEATRQVALAATKRAMGDDAAARISADGVIERLRLAYASGFSLALQQSAGGFDFDPVLFGRERLDAADDGAAIDEVDDGLLPPALAAGFARRFRGGDGERRTYLLDDGSLLFVDPQLARALGVVRTAQAGTTEERRAFATAPERHIAAALRADGDAPADAARLFVETQQFSERVAGIDIWRKPVMPWIKPKPGSWLPEAFGVRVGEPPDAFTVEIPPERIAEAATAAEQAVREERATFMLEGVAIPATQATLAALASLSDLTEAARTPHADAAPPPALAGRYFLQVRDNLEEVAYTPLAPPDVAALPAPALPPTLRSAAKPHQVAGFAWLAACWQAGMPGALLADDMGLGKTYQALALLAWLRGQAPHPRPVLIVAPTGLLANWRAEIARHLEPDALGRVVGAYGSALSQLRGGAGRDIDSGASAIDPAAWAHAGVVLTTYETMRDYHLSFARQPFSAILYDEAQKLKNPASQITRAAKTLNARFQLALTGTPVENRLQDLWSIVDVVHPGLLGSSKAFEEAYPPEPDALGKLHARLTLPQGERPPVLLRRLKEECLDSLPAKHVRAMPVAMPPRQAAAYDRVVARALAIKGTGERGRMLEILHQLRGVSLHPVSPGEAGSESGSDDGYFGDSARLEALFAVLDDVAAKREKALIFCESLAMQALLAVEIRRRYSLPHPVIRIHGGVAGDARQAAVDVFQARAPGFDAMILSPKAGGVGLTLTAANHVVHLSRWWNPAVEDQATDRAYRIGQTRDVTVYLPQAIHPDAGVAPMSFDLKLHALMERKRSLSRGLLAPGDDESDASALFDSVVAEEAVPTLPSKPEPKPAAPLSPERPRLQLRPRTTPEPPPSPPVPRGDWPRRAIYQAGAARNLAIFTGPVGDDPVRELVIVDPYAAAGERARQSLVDFVGLLAGSAAIDEVQLITFDADSIDLPVPESSEHQRLDLRARWQARFGASRGLQHFQRSKRQNRNLHDREVRATTRSGRTLIWDLGRGIDGVMQTRHGCRVTLTEE